MKILFEDTIPFGYEYLSELAEVTRYAWQSLTPEDVADADIMAIRSTTKINATLLEKASSLSFVTTATSGTNHIDGSYLNQRGIAFDDAGGCNAVAVAEYVLSTLFNAHNAQKLSLPNITVGIVGAGHVGSALSARLVALGVDVKLCDPPLQAAGDKREFCSFEEILTCDVITLHVPYVPSGPHATANLINERVLASLKSSQLLINACRGEVIDEAALIARLKQDNAPTVVLDVFNNEPSINLDLLAHCWMVTPHIAGHSVEGKVRGTQIIYEQIAARLGKPVSKSLNDFLDTLPEKNVTFSATSSQMLDINDIGQLFLSVYNIADDDKKMREALAAAGADVASTFASLRKKYRIRRECTAYTLKPASTLSSPSQQTLVQLGFGLVGHAV